MSRLITTVTCLCLLTSTLLVSASDNPFARWEKLKAETDASLEAAEAAKQAPTAASGQVAPRTGQSQFFSGRSVAVDITDESLAKPATDSSKQNAVRKERLRTAAATSEDSQPTSKKIVQAAAVEEAESRIEQVDGEFFELLEEPMPQAAAQEQQAVSPTADETLSSESQPTVDEEENPFAEFLAQEMELATDDDLQHRAELVNQLPAGNSAAVPTEEFSAPPVVTAAENIDPFLPVSASSEIMTPASTETTPRFRPQPTTGPQQSRITMEWVRKEEFNVGQPCQCELLVRNDSDSAVRSVEVEVVLPEGVQVTRAIPAPTATSASATWSYQELAAGERKTIELTVIPQQPGDVRMDAFVRTTAAAASLVNVKQPMLAISVGGPETIELGQQVHYTVTVRNPGTGRVNNVLIQAAIPDGLKHRQGKLLNIDVGTLNAGEQRQARLSVTGVTGGSRELAVRAVGDGGLKEEATTSVLVAEPKLRIGVRGPEIQTAGATNTYDVVVVNEGQVDSNNVRARYQVPAGYTFVSASSGGHFNSKETTIEWFVGTLSPDAAKRFQVELKANRTGEADHRVGVISEQGKVSTAAHQTKVQGNAKLELKLASSHQNAAVGDELVYKIQINNIGQAPAKNVGLSFEVPPGVDLVEVTGPSEYIADNGVVIFRSLPEMLNGKSVTFTVRTKCVRSGEHQVRARVASQSIRRAIIAEETTKAR